MPRIDKAQVPIRQSSAYPAIYASKSANRTKQFLARFGGLTDFGVNLVTLQPGDWSAQRHWHTHEDEFIYILSGEALLINNSGETHLVAGDCAAFPKNDGNGHHLVNRSNQPVRYLEVGSRFEDDRVHYSDVDMQGIKKASYTFTHKDGSPFED